MKRILTPITLFVCSVSLYAQQSFTNNGNLQLHAGASMTGFGAFTNNASASFVNNGTFYVQGNISNSQPSMATGTGHLHLNGSSAQALNGSQAFKTYHFTSDNTAGITLNNNLSVSGVHSFSGGVITTSATPNYMVYEAGSSYTGDADTRHINGWVKKLGNTNFVFPVGNGTIERTVAMNSLSASGEFNARYYSATPFTSQMTPPVWDVHDNEYWAVNRVSGGTATLTLNWNYSKVYFPNWIVSDILVTGYNGSSWINNGGAGTASGTPATTGSVTSSAISSFNLFALGSRSYILPLTLIDFNAFRQENYTKVNWITERENNVARFVVERSDDGISFYPIAQQPARNSGATEQYAIRDYAAIQHTAYYRLRTIDAGSRESLSKTVAVSVDGDNRLTLLVNPVKDKIMLMATPALNGLFQYRISAINGQLAQKGSLQIQNGGSYQIALTQKLPGGIYTLEITNGTEFFHFKIAVQ